MIIRLLLPIIAFVFLILEGVAIDLLPTVITSQQLLIVPHWIFIFLLLVNLFYDTNDSYYAIVYGLFFGLLIDIVYTDLLGVYMFVYPFALYVIHLMKRILHTNFLMSIVILIVSLTVVELSIYFIYLLTGMISSPISFFFLNRLLPTIIANVLFIVPLYILFVKRLDKWSRVRFDTLQ